jgi:hypothetical protein
MNAGNVMMRDLTTLTVLLAKVSCVLLVGPFFPRNAAKVRNFPPKILSWPALTKYSFLKSVPLSTGVEFGGMNYCAFYILLSHKV